MADGDTLFQNFETFFYNFIALRANASFDHKFYLVFDKFIFIVFIPQERI